MKNLFSKTLLVIAIVTIMILLYFIGDMNGYFKGQTDYSKGIIKYRLVKDTISHSRWERIK